ncbi:MAG TPA: hypothetical protein O0X38_03425 [Methanocorpusculum sp.]|nr:hypothetical protein [Methanocorpusculum sp.]
MRFTTARDGKSLNRAVPMGALFIVMMTGVAFTVGPLTNVYFMETTGQLALAAAGGNADSVIPLYINAAMPELFVIIFMLTLLSAAMSTLSSLLHTMGTTLSGDMFARLKGKRYSVRANQVGIVVMMLASLAIAVVMPESIIARATAMFMGLAVVDAPAMEAHVLLPVRRQCLWVCVRRRFCLRLHMVLFQRRRRCLRRSGVWLQVREAGWCGRCLPIRRSRRPSGSVMRCSELIRWLQVRGIIWILWWWERFCRWLCCWF